MQESLGDATQRNNYIVYIMFNFKTEEYTAVHFKPKYMSELKSF